MDDFSSNFTNGFDVPPTDHNLIEPEKRPLSSMCPSFFIDEFGNIRLVIGGTGGTKITTSVAAVAIRHLWMNDNIKQAIDWPRLHHQLLPNEIFFDNNFPTDILSQLEWLGHKTTSLGTDSEASTVMAVNQLNGSVYANSDFRKGGSVDGI